MLCGCPDPNVYGTPRTLEPGDLQVQISMSGFGGTANGKTDFSTGLPSIGFRLGVADRFDVGARVSDFSSLEGDAKFNFLRGRVDMALDPSAHVLYSDLHSAPIGALQLHLPLLIGLNFDEYSTLVLTPGFVATMATADAVGTGLSMAEAAPLSPGVGARLGLGLNLRGSHRFSWQPEVTVWHDFNAVQSWVYVFGIGLNIGAQPAYEDLSDDGASQ
jgi:hypothetical protein